MLMLSVPLLRTPPLMQDTGGNIEGGGEQDERNVEGVPSLEPGIQRQGGWFALNLDCRVYVKLLYVCKVRIFKCFAVRLGASQTTNFATWI